MGNNNAPTNQGASGAVGVEDDLTAGLRQRREEHKRQIGSLFNLPVIGVLGMGGQRKTYPTETLVADMTGQGLSKGLPTADDNGEIKLVYRQVRLVPASSLWPL